MEINTGRITETATISIERYTEMVEAVAERNRLRAEKELLVQNIIKALKVSEWESRSSCDFDLLKIDVNAIKSILVGVDHDRIMNAFAKIREDYYKKLDEEMEKNNG